MLQHSYQLRPSVSFKIRVIHLLLINFKNIYGNNIEKYNQYKTYLLCKLIVTNLFISYSKIILQIIETKKKRALNYF